MVFDTDTSMSDVIALLLWRNLANPKLPIGQTIIQFERLSLEAYRQEHKLKPMLAEYRLLPNISPTSIVTSVVLLHHAWFSKIANNLYCPNYPDTTISLIHLIRVITDNTNHEILTKQAYNILDKGFLK